jgi:hypothetical protein
MRIPLDPMRTLLFMPLLAAILPVALGLALPAPAEAQVSARVWVDGNREFLRHGDRADVRFSVSGDSYVAVVHIDTDGNVDFLHPANPWDNSFVRGGRTYSVANRGSSAWTVRGPSGIGYFYILASPVPLDFSPFRTTGLSSWHWGYAGRSVRGDPFLAFEQITRILLPRGGSVRYAADYYGYHVGGIHQYPSYACLGRGHVVSAASWGWGWTPSYGPCDRVALFLRSNPYYYDTRRFRGDRRTYWREYESLDPRHGFKEAPDRSRPPAPAPRADQRGGASTATPAGQPRREPPRSEPPPATSGDRRGEAPAARPSTERAPEPPSSTPRTRPTPESSGRSPAPSREPAAAPPSRGTPSTAPARRPAPR